MLKPHIFYNFHFYDIPSVYFIKNNSKASGCNPILTTILTGLSIWSNEIANSNSQRGHETAPLPPRGVLQYSFPPLLCNIVIYSEACKFVDAICPRAHEFHPSSFECWTWSQNADWRNRRTTNNRGEVQVEEVSENVQEQLKLCHPFPITARCNTYSASIVPRTCIKILNIYLVFHTFLRYNQWHSWHNH